MISPAVEQLLTTFPDIFEEPTELPLRRAKHDHKIVLKDGVDPVVLVKKKDGSW